MSQLIETHKLTPEHITAMNTLDREQVYNSLDCCITDEVLGAMNRLSNQSPIIYDFERALQAPILEIMLRGFKIDQFERKRALADLQAIVTKLDHRLQRLACEIQGKPLNVNSPKQMLEFFYSHMGLKPIYVSNKGQRKLSMNREVLEKLQQDYLAMPIIALILTIKEHTKSIQTLSTEVSPNGRMHTSYNIGATETGRLSSSKDAFGYGGNLQNWKERLRRCFIADKGWKLGAIDLEQAESREIGFLMGVLFNDWRYLDACEGGDLHTFSARLIWPELPWNGDLKKDRAIAEQTFYRDFSYRDMSKRGGHATSYVGQPFTISRHLKVPRKLIEVFQERFFAAFPAFPKLFMWVSYQLQTEKELCTYFGRVRHFFGRPNDDATLREGVAFMGQSPTADRTNFGLYKLWSQHRERIRLLAQLHDAVYFQFREDDDEEQVMQLALECMRTEVVAPNGRKFVVPGEAKTGWNWSKEHDSGKPLNAKTNPYNPNGLRKFKGKDSRKRLEGLETPL